MALELTQPASLRRHARKLIAAGLVVMVIAALDPLEGSILLVVGGILLVWTSRQR